MTRRYADGNANIAPHSDKTASMVSGSYIFDASFGATRTLVLRPLSQEQRDKVGGLAKEAKIAQEDIRVEMTDGSAFIMGPLTNACYSHEIEKDPSGESCGDRFCIIWRAIQELRRPKHPHTADELKRIRERAEGMRAKASKREAEWAEKRASKGKSKSAKRKASSNKASRGKKRAKKVVVDTQDDHVKLTIGNQTIKLDIEL